jgi:hypothetical protein
MTTNEVPPGRYRVIYSDMSAGGHAEFSAADDQAAWEYAERTAYDARIVQLARVQLGTVDRIQVLSRPGQENKRTRNPGNLEPVPPPQPEPPGVARLHQQALADLAALPEDHDNEISEDLSTPLGCARLLWQIVDRVYGGASPGELVSAALDVATALAGQPDLRQDAP